MPSAQQTVEITGRPTASQVSRMRRRSFASVSTGSLKMSIVSKPMSLVRRMPSSVPIGEPSQAELINPSFTGSPHDFVQENGPVFGQRAVRRIYQGHRAQVVAAADDRIPLFRDAVKELGHRSGKRVGERS